MRKNEPRNTRVPMKQQLLLGALLVGGALSFQNISVGHGGTYRGPGDTVPPGGGETGGPGGPSSGGPGGPGAPGGPGPSTGTPGGPGALGGPAGGSTPTTGAPATTGIDLTNWQFWWGFNKDPYLNLKAKLHDYTETGSDVFFLGHGEQGEARDTRRTSETTIRETIVPALIKALKTEKNNDILTGAMVALAKIGDAKDLEGNSEFEALIATFLSDSVQEVRETAATALGILANPKSISTLEHLALDDNQGRMLVGRKSEVSYRTRAFAIYGLGLVGHKASVPDRERIVTTLAQILAERKMSTRDVKIAAIIAMGLVPIANLEATPTSDNPSDSQRPSVSRTQQIGYLVDLLKDKRAHTLLRAQAPRSIALLLAGTSEELRAETARILLGFVGKNSSQHRRELRQSATLALGQIGNCDGDGIDARIHEELLQGISDPDQQAKFFSLIALAQVAGRPGDLAAPRGSFDAMVLKETRKHLSKQLSRGGQVKAWAALSFGVLGHALSSHKEPMSADASLALRSVAKRTSSPATIGAYAIAAGLRKDQDSIALFEGKLDQISDDETRGHIAISLGLMDSRGSIEKIQAIVRKSKYRPALLKQAAIALGLLGDKQTVPELTRMLRDARSLATQASVAQALGFIGDSRSVEPLVGMLGDSQLTSRARAFAAVALGIVADKEILPWNSKVSVDINYRANTPTLTSQDGTGLLDIL